ncbi:MAG: hypothetical protein LBC74_14300 [Planctomycetaceae bacterium]|nr:hypothetical protein [Planctomycetaceae bacterium]
MVSYRLAKRSNDTNLFCFKNFKIHVKACFPINKQAMVNDQYFCLSYLIIVATIRRRLFFCLFCRFHEGGLERVGKCITITPRFDFGRSVNLV